jgi:hypothetical protein
MFKSSLKISLLASVVLLGGCAYLIEDQIQDIEFATPGAYDAVCNVYVDGVRYNVHPPQTTSIHKSKNDMVVDCMAPGNRRKKIYIQPKISKASKWNLATAGTGYVYDYASNALFTYPDKVIVDFTAAPTTDAPPPAQNSPDIRQPEDYLLEEFNPAQPRLNSDKGAQDVEILRRGESAYGEADFGDSSAFSGSAAESQGKGTLMDAAPADQVPAAQFSPMPIIPGE